MSPQPIIHRLQSHTMYEKASFIQDYAVKVQMVLDKDRSAKRYKVRDIRSLQSLIEKSDNLDNLYIKWIIQRYSQNKMQMVEDILSKAIPALERYQDLKKRNQLQGNHKNLQRIKDIHQLLDIMDEYQDTQSRSEQKDSIEQGFYDRKEAVLIHDDSKIKVVVPKTEKASCYFGMGTQWCTAANKNNMFNDYTEDGYILYYIFFKGVTDERNYKWAIAVATQGRYRGDAIPFDARDWTPGTETIIQIRSQYPVLRKIFKDTVAFGKKPPLEVMKRTVLSETSTIELIENPPVEIQLRAIRRNKKAWHWIAKPSKEATP